MKFSLIMATVGREEPIAVFLRSLAGQGDVDVELIIVDQNADDRVERVLARRSAGIVYKHVRSAPGVSRARNAGLGHIDGDVVAFPDDDCEYPPGLLGWVRGFLNYKIVYGGLALRVASREGQAIGRLARESGEVSPLSVWRQATSAGLFLRRGLIEAVGDFDETLGLGAGTPWGAGEDIDYPLRALQAGFRLYYEAAKVVWHPDVMLERRDHLATRGYRYGAGWGRVRRKHASPYWIVAYYVMRSLGGAIMSLVVGDFGAARFRLAVFAGRIRGWLA